MNRREGYITIEITQSGGGGGGTRRPKERREEAPEMRGQLGVPVFGQGAISPWDIGPSSSVYFSPLKQAIASLESNFWTHYLQIHYNGPGLKTETLQLAPFVGKLLVR